MCARDWNEHFVSWLNGVIIPGIMLIYEKDKLPDTFQLHPQKLRMTITAPEGRMFENLAQLRSIMREYDRDHNNLHVTIESNYVREVVGRPDPPGDDDTYHIGHAVLEYRFVSSTHNCTGSIGVTGRHPNRCEWGG